MYLTKNALKSLKPKRTNKYGAHGFRDAEGRWDSKAEHARWKTLKLLEQAKKISNLRRQVKFSLDVNGAHICNYIADFEYIDVSGGKSWSQHHRVVEDVKSKATKTRLYEIKKKLMKAIHGISIVEIIPGS